MSVVIILIVISLVLALLFLGCFVWAVRSGQYEDTATPAIRLLAEDENRHSPTQQIEHKSEPK